MINNLETARMLIILEEIFMSFFILKITGVILLMSPYFTLIAPLSETKYQREGYKALPCAAFYLSTKYP